MSVTILDVLVILVVLISAILAMVRGFVREVLSVGSWVAAVAAAYFFYEPFVPLISPYIESQTVATMVTGSPGMEGPQKHPYQVLTFDGEGKTSVYADR